CQEAPLLYPSNAPIQIREACALTERKCTQCHDRERIVYARHNPAEWRNTVERMRRFPGSAISVADTDTIVRCLSYSSESSVSFLDVKGRD
ncbi:MAG: hypothetical protein H0V17_30100, partial [Deltaproteobacteria bacterium]|nr:hypothetical protein [Deltaproteobacteria bacterium]